MCIIKCDGIDFEFGAHLEKGRFFFFFFQKIILLQSSFLCNNRFKVFFFNVRLVTFGKRIDT